MKKFIYLIALTFIIQSANAQELYQYTKDSVITTNVGDIHILDVYSTSIGYSKVTPVYNQREVAFCSDETIKRDEYGRFIVDKNKYSKPMQLTIQNVVKMYFASYRTLLKSAFDGKGQIWITFQIGSTGSFKNAEVIIWAEPSIYRQIPPEVLCRFINALGELQFTIPPEYQCISDHYFHYSVFFKDL